MSSTFFTFREILFSNLTNCDILKSINPWGYLNMNKFPQRLKELRTAKNISQEELGKHLNLRDSTISQYESGKRTPDYSTLLKIADFFGVTTDYLLGRTVYQQPPQKHYLIRDSSTSCPTIAAHRIDSIFDRDDVPEEAKKSVEEFIDFVKKKYGIND